MKKIVNLKNELSTLESSVIAKPKLLLCPNSPINGKSFGFHDAEKQAELGNLLGYLSFFMATLAVISLSLGIIFYVCGADAKKICEPLTPSWFPLFVSILFITLIVFTPVLIMCSMLFSQGEDKLAAWSAVLYFGICPILYFFFTGGDFVPQEMERHNQSGTHKKAY